MVRCGILAVIPCHSLAAPGVKLLKEYQAEYANFEAQRQELTSAEKLFDLPITMYADLIEVDKELRNLAKVYELYEAQRVCRQHEHQAAHVLQLMGKLYLNMSL